MPLPFYCQVMSLFASPTAVELDCAHELPLPLRKDARLRAAINNFLVAAVPTVVPPQVPGVQHTQAPTSEASADVASVGSAATVACGGSGGSEVGVAVHPAPPAESDAMADAEEAETAVVDSGAAATEEGAGGVEGAGSVGARRGERSKAAQGVMQDLFVKKLWFRTLKARGEQREREHKEQQEQKEQQREHKEHKEQQKQKEQQGHTGAQAAAIAAAPGTNDPSVVSVVSSGALSRSLRFETEAMAATKGRQWDACAAAFAASGVVLLQRTGGDVSADELLRESLRRAREHVLGRLAVLRAASGACGSEEERPPVRSPTGPHRPLRQQRSRSSPRHRRLRPQRPRAPAA